jgi:hypothetical protein
LATSIHVDSLAIARAEISQWGDGLSVASLAAKQNTERAKRFLHWTIYLIAKSVVARATQKSAFL